MKSKRLDLSGLSKQGLTPAFSAFSKVGWRSLKNLKTNGTTLIPCPIEVTTKIEACRPLTLGTVDYYILADGIYKQGTGLIHACTFSGIVKIVNMISVVWIQDSLTTLILDKDGVYTSNPSGNTIPIANDLCIMNGQIIIAGPSSGILDLDAGFVAWSAIGSDDFDLTKQNDSGCYSPNIGTVLNVLPLQDSVIVLGTRGACQMYYAGHIFGFRDLDIPLLKSRGLCASSTNFAFYISQSGSIVKVDKNGEFESLGFEWIGSSTLDVKYYNGRNLFAFSTSSETFLLDKAGMFSFGYKTYGEFNASLVVESAFEQDTYECYSTMWDCERAGLKRITEIYLNVTPSMSALNQQVIGYGDDFTTTPGWKNLNRWGVCKYIISGYQIAFGFKTTVPTEISGMQLEMLFADQRYGSGAAPMVGGAINAN